MYTILVQSKVMGKIFSKSMYLHVLSINMNASNSIQICNTFIQFDFKRELFCGGKNSDHMIQLDIFLKVLKIQFLLDLSLILHKLATMLSPMLI